MEMEIEMREMEEREDVMEKKGAERSQPGLETRARRLR